jgi:hypothetical protein
VGITNNDRLPDGFGVNINTQVGAWIKRIADFKFVLEATLTIILYDGKMQM